MTIRSLVLMAIMLAAGLTVVMRGSAPPLALAAATVVLTAWALVSFLQWREAFGPGPLRSLPLPRRRARDGR